MGSCKFSEARRSYLRELAAHRDKQRKPTAKTARALASLAEDPIMFYEPLDVVLDEPTKQFVREVVEERIKLEMQVGGMKEEIQEEEIKEDSSDYGDRPDNSRELQAELKQLRIALAKETDARKKLE